MALLLCIETATEICSVALSRDTEVIYSHCISEPNAHSAQLFQMIHHAISVAGITASALDAVAVSAGPGSYTGLRIGLSAAKGMAYAADIPVISIGTLEAMAWGIKLSHASEGQGCFCPMIDARRMEVYCAIYDAELNTLRPISADIINDQSFIDFLSTNKVCFFGNGAKKCRDIIAHPNALFIDDIVPLASQMGALAQRKFDTGQFENAAYYEPHYLKEFVAKISVNKVLHG